jgi:hypothetical protein
MISYIATPVLKETQAQAIAFLLLLGKWPKERIQEKLALFQTGVSQEGENDPYFVAAKIINKSHTATNRRDKLNTTKELGVVIFAMLETEKGVKAAPASKFRDAVKKEVPTPACDEFASDCDKIH